MAAKVFGSVPNPNVDRPVSTDSTSSTISSRSTVKESSKVDGTILDKAMAGILPSEMRAMVEAAFKGAYEQLYNMSAIPWSRGPETEGKYPQAFIEDPKQFYEAHFLSNDTSKVPEFRMIGQILTNPQDAMKKGWLTPKQAEALQFFLTHREQQQTYAAKGATGASQEGMGGDSQGDHKDEYEEFYKNMTETEGVGPSSGTSTPQAYYYSGGSSGGGTPPSGGGMTSLRQNYTGTGGGGSTSPSGSPTGPGGFAPPPPPPPPPPPSGSGAGGGNTPYDEYMNRLPGMMQTENDYLNNNFYQGDPFYGWFQNLFGSENWYRDFAAKSLTELQAIKGAKEQIMAELAHIDSSKPEGAKKLYILQQKLSDLQQNERQSYDNISSAQKANNERKEMIKAIFEMYFQTAGAIVRNIGK